jgi:uncharacterized protein (TIGR03437 family)
MFDGTPAPLLYAGANQVNAIAPYAIYGNTSTKIQVTREGSTTGEVELAVAEASPSIFTIDGTGVGPGAILNQDLTVNSPLEAAEKGSTIILFATGAGQTDPGGTDGEVAGAVLARPLLPVSVRIGGVDAKILYAGAAPGMVAGVLQVNCTVPANAPSGPSVPIVLSIGHFDSPLGVTAAIQ